MFRKRPPKIAAQVTGSVSAPLFFAEFLGTSNVYYVNTSVAAFVRNKWCLVFDRSGSMCLGFDWHRLVTTPV